MDASVALPWFLEDPISTYPKRVRAEIIAGARPLVPALWQLELANGLWLAERRGILGPLRLEQAIVDIEAMLAHLIDCESAVVSVRQSLSTARPFGVTAYDAVYLDAARRHGIPLATQDRKLAAAAERGGVRLFGA